MSHGERAAAKGWGHSSREYWGRRLFGMWAWGRAGKWMTHRAERRAARRAREAIGRNLADEVRQCGAKRLLVEAEEIEKGGGA